MTPESAGEPWVRGETALSVYAGWNRFVSPFGNPVPDVGSFIGGDLPAEAEDFGFDVVDTSGASFVTSTSNLYSFDTATAFDVTVPGFGLGEGFTTIVILQVRVLGVEIDPESVLIGDEPPASSEELFRGDTTEGIGFGGLDVGTRYRWALPGSEAGYVISFAASSSSMSLSELSVDTFVMSSADVPCSPADVARSGGAFGSLDGNDIGGFVSAFLTNDLSVADIAATNGSFGTLDGNDIGAFVSAFLEGCP